MTDRPPNNLTHKPVADAADYLTGLAQDGCTGHLDVYGDNDDIGIIHDGDTCPVHEPPPQRFVSLIPLTLDETDNPHTLHDVARLYLSCADRPLAHHEVSTDRRDRRPDALTTYERQDIISAIENVIVDWEHSDPGDDAIKVRNDAWVERLRAVRAKLSARD